MQSDLEKGGEEDEEKKTEPELVQPTPGGPLSLEPFIFDF